MNTETAATCWKLFTDGSSCPQKKTTGIGFALYMPESDEPVQRFKKSIPYVTTPTAEYKALILGLEAIHQKGARVVEVRSDAQGMVNQLNGVCKVNVAHLKPLYEEAKEQIARFVTVRVVYVGRKQNTVADGLAKEALNPAKPTSGTSAIATKTVPLKRNAATQQVTAPLPVRPQQFWKPVGNELCVWNLENLWRIAADLPLETVALTDLQPLLDTPGWFGDEPLTLRRIAELSYQTANADSEEPLLLHGVELLDGRFRLAKALCNGREAITLKRLRNLPKPDVRYPLNYAP